MHRCRDWKHLCSRKLICGHLGRKAWHNFIFKIPLFGDLIRKSLLARISLVMGNLNQAGVDILESLDIAKSVSTNTVVTESLENIKKGFIVSNIFRSM